MWELDLSDSGERVAADFYEHGNEFTCSLRRVKFIE
jgi:hypothetical protein